MDYYQKKIFIAKVNKNDKVLGKIERWQAHREKIPHRGFTTILIYNQQFIIQHRKHPVFDGVFDLSFSSHPSYVDNKLETMEQAIIKTLLREWLIEKKNIDKPIFLEKYYYLEKDKKSVFFEHEINHLYLIKLKKMIKNNQQFSYGMFVLTPKELIKNKDKIDFAPWVKMIDFNQLLFKIKKYEPALV